MELLGVADGTGFANNGDLHLTGIGHLVLYASGYVGTEGFNLSVVNLIGTHNDTQFTACLNGISLGDTVVAGCYLFEVVEALDVSLDYLATGAGTGAADGIADLYDRSEQGCHLYLIVVGTNGIADICLLFVLLSQLGTIECVWQLAFLVRHFTYIVEQTGALGFLGIEAQLSGHDGAEVGCLAGMLKEVLTIRGTVLHLADNADELRVKTVNAEVDGGSLTGLYDLVFDLLLNLVDHFLNAGRVDAAVCNKLVKG